jgi:uridine kinase
VRRAAERDGWSAEVEAVENRRYVEGQRLYLRECDPQAVASIVVDNSDLARPVVTAMRPPFA